MATMIVVVGGNECNCEEGGTGINNSFCKSSFFALHLAFCLIGHLRLALDRIGRWAEGEINNLYCKLVQRAAETRNAPKHLHLL